MEGSLQESKAAFLKHQFLMAMPNLTDPNFARTVTCICEHSSMGAFGLIVNRLHPFLTAKAVFKELGLQYRKEIASLPVFFGGPVHEGELFILHGPPLAWEGSILLSRTLSMSNTLDVLTAIAMGQGPSSYMIVLGCAGWGPGQLESEIKANAWLTGPLMEEVVFETPVEKRWEEALRKIGIDPSLLTDRAGHA